MESKSSVVVVRRGYEAPTARIAAVGSGCVVRASDGYWTAAPFIDPVDGGDWGYGDGDVHTTAAQFVDPPLGGLWCDPGGSSSASPFSSDIGKGVWGGDGGSSAGKFEEAQGRW